MGEVDSDHWMDHMSQRLDQVLQQDHQVERSEDVGLRVTITTRAEPTVSSSSLPQPPPLLQPVAAPAPKPIKVSLKLVVAPKAVQPESSQPSTSQEKTGPDKDKEKTMKKKKKSRPEAMEMDDRASVEGNTTRST